ncbi:MAG: putative SOS response-associated peptidase YedK [Akkermansiaceae bacterium]|jgi:putative SOS response-associated peptidase YedK
MCNAFNTARKPEALRSAHFPGDTRLIRRTDPAPVILPSGEIKTMRWGFQRKSLGPVNNTRSDNLDSSMWRDAITKRRCLIPVTSHYEWTGPIGHKITHLFQNPKNEWLWIAGLWEDSPDHGPCFSMLTTEANSLVAPIHHRMPAILTPDEQKIYLDKGLTTFQPAPELLITKTTLNPLLKNPPTHI